MEDPKSLQISLIGTPNSGKTTLFNALTRSREHVGNYPGVTVDLASGLFRHRGYDVVIQDLPGLYSIHTASAEELVTVKSLFEQAPDLTLLACDASNLERGLHLVLQMIELGIPLCLVITKTDILDQLGIDLDTERLARLVKCPVLTLGKDENEAGFESFFDALLAAALTGAIPQPFRYPQEIENEIGQIQLALASSEPKISSTRALASALISAVNSPVIAYTGQSIPESVHQEVDHSRNHLRTVYNETPAMTITQARYGIVRGMLRECQTSTKEGSSGLHDFLDHLFLWRLTGIPLLLVTLFFIFFIPFVAGAPLSGLVDGLFSDLASFVREHFEPGGLRDLVSDGIIGGVGGVLVFLPQLFLLYTVIAFIESSGYMARAAFVLDAFMHRIGLHGKSFLPFLLGFGCTVPAILATRILENRNDRLATMMALPFISCSARLPVFTLLIAALFPPHWGGLILLGLYSFGIIMALLTARFFRRRVFRVAHEPIFLMDLPPWRLPTVFSIVHQAGEQTLYFIKKAGTILLAAAIVFWFLSNHPGPSEKDMAARTSAFASLRATAASAIPIEIKTNPAVAMARSSIVQIWSDFSNTVSNDSPLSQHYRIAESRRTHAIASISNRDASSFISAMALIRDEQALQSAISVAEQAWRDTVRMQSYAGQLGSLIAPLLAPMGLDDWKMAVALISGFAAKEMVVTTLGSIYGTREDDTEGLTSRIRRDPVFLSKHRIPPSAVLMTEAGQLRHAQNALPITRVKDEFHAADPVTALALLVFILLYVPCQAATLVFAREAGIRLALVMILWTTGIAWVMATIVYQLGQLVS